MLLPNVIGRSSFFGLVDDSQAAKQSSSAAAHVERRRIGLRYRWEQRVAIGWNGSRPTFPERTARTIRPPDGVAQQPPSTLDVRHSEELAELIRLARIRIE